tara:strand:+ start:130 stop:603 length:474 start_codon:yes stop_codon:yes gene_type:complete
MNYLELVADPTTRFFTICASSWLVGGIVEGFNKIREHHAIEKLEKLAAYSETRDGIRMLAFSPDSHPEANRVRDYLTRMSIEDDFFKKSIPVLASITGALASTYNSPPASFDDFVQGLAYFSVGYIFSKFGRDTLGEKIGMISHKLDPRKESTTKTK